MPQPPAVQVAVPLAGTGQACPHVPQFDGSVCVSAQAVEQKDWPAGQEQVPPVQGSPTGHPWAQTPQLSGSVVTSTQEAPQVV